MDNKAQAQTLAPLLAPSWDIDLLRQAAEAYDQKGHHVPVRVEDCSEQAARVVDEVLKDPGFRASLEDRVTAFLKAYICNRV